MERMARFEKPKDKIVITREKATMLRESANSSRRQGTPTDMLIARSSDELVDRAIDIAPN